MVGQLLAGEFDVGDNQIRAVVLKVGEGIVDGVERIVYME